MKDFIQPILDLVMSIVDRYGVKSLVAMGGVAALWDLTKTGTVPGEWGAIAIAAIVVGYFVVRRLEGIEVAHFVHEEEEPVKMKLDKAKPYDGVPL